MPDVDTNEIVAMMDCIQGDIDGEVTMAELVRYYTPDLGVSDIKHANTIGKNNAIQMVALILELDKKVLGKSVFSADDATISVDDLKHLAEQTPPKYVTQLYEHKNGSPVYETDQSLRLSDFGRGIYKQATDFVALHTQ